MKWTTRYAPGFRRPGYRLRKNSTTLNLNLILFLCHVDELRDRFCYNLVYHKGPKVFSLTRVLSDDLWGFLFEVPPKYLNLRIDLLRIELSY